MAGNSRCCPADKSIDVALKIGGEKINATGVMF